LKMLLSINPEHVVNIMNGSKRFEFRKVRTRRDVRHMVIYSTAPVGLVVGEAEIIGTICGSPQEVWAATSEHSGISREFFDRYYAGRNHAVAYELGQVDKYTRPKTLNEMGIRSAPQSFAYLRA